MYKTGQIERYVMCDVHVTCIVCDRFVLNMPNAVCCFLSHIKCWEYLLQEDEPYALILEDDCCFSDQFSDSLNALLQNNLPEWWDFILLGYYSHLHAMGISTSTFTHNHNSVIPVHLFYGAHCYLMSRQGAKRLLSLAFPMQLHVDLFMYVVSQRKDVTAFMFPQSIAFQCQKWTERSMDHFNVFSFNYKFLLPHIPVFFVIVLVILIGFTNTSSR